MMADLPLSIQVAAKAAFRLFRANPTHPGLRLHRLGESKKGQHLPGSVSVSVTWKYRAIHVEQSGVNIWYWIGSHADDDAFIGRK